MRIVSDGKGKALLLLSPLILEEHSNTNPDKTF